MAYYVLTREYRPGMILEQLPAGDYTKILGLDIGSEKTSACLCWYNKETGRWRYQLLPLDEEGNYSMPTCISYRDDQVFIGHEAEQGWYTQGFQYPPAQWNLRPDGVHTAERMQRDFVARLFQQMKETASDLLTEEKMLVAVGCPTSEDWMENDDYKKLVQEAIGCSDVDIVPEGRASILGELMRGDLDPKKGLAVYDLGARSAKVSYLMPGKCFRSRSRELGESRVDEALFDCLFADTDCSFEDEKSLIPQIRQIKKTYYPRKGPAGGELKDRNGNVIRSLTLNDTLMHQVLGIGEDGVPVDGSWFDQLERFFNETKEWIGDLPCGNVILAGGNSWIPEVLELSEKVFSDWDAVVKRARDPEAAMAYGLCDIKRREIQTVRGYEGSYGSLMEGIKECGSQWYPNYVNAFVGKIAGKSRDLVRQLAQPYWESNRSVHVDVFADKSKAALQKAFTHEALVRTQAEVLVALERTEQKAPDFVSSAEFARPEDPVEETTIEYYTALRNRLSAAVMNYAWWLSAGKDWKAWMEKILTSYLGGLDTAEIREALARIYPAQTEAQKIVEGYLSKGLKPGLTSARLFWAPTKGAVRKARDKLKDTLTPEALEEGWKAFVGHSAKGLEKSEEFRQQFAELNQSLFEIALGQLLLLVFEEKADVQ